VGSAVANSEVERLDSVGEANIVAGLRIGTRSVGSNGCSLNLLNEDITSSAGHLLTLIVGNNSVVSPDTDILKVRGSSDIAEVINSGLATSGRRNSSVDCKKIIPVSEGEINSHIIVRKSSSGEGDTSIAREEERKRNVKSIFRERSLSERSSGRLNENINVSDHVLVTIILALGKSEGSPEVKVVVVKASGNEIVESDAALLDKIVTNVVSPTSPDTGDRCKLGESAAEPSLEEVITSTGDGDSPVVVATVEVGGSASTGENNGNLGEPGGLVVLTNEVGEGLSVTTV
jgi:hypothetical protein